MCIARQDAGLLTGPHQYCPGTVRHYKRGDTCQAAIDEVRQEGRGPQLLFRARTATTWRPLPPRSARVDGVVQIMGVARAHVPRAKVANARVNATLIPWALALARFAHPDMFRNCTANASTSWCGAPTSPPMPATPWPRPWFRALWWTKKDNCESSCPMTS